jgi:hypothetical protein
MDVEYILGCALEMGEITALEETTLRRNQAAYRQVDDAVRAERAWPAHFLANTARAALDAAPQQERYFLALCSMAPLQWAMQALAERAAFLVQSRLQRDLGVGTPSPLQLFPELAAPRTAPAVTCEADIGEGVVRNLLDEMLAPVSLRMFDDLDLVREALAWFRQDQGARFVQMLEGTALPASQALPAEHLLKLAATTAKKRAQEQRTIVSRAKAAIKKATKLFGSLGQEGNLKLFVSGAEVTLSHPDSRFKLVVKPLQVAGWLIDRTQAGRAHTPYELSLYTKDDVFMTHLCVYFKDTPVLDQLLALTFYVQSGDELAILEKANWYGTGDWDKSKTELVLASYPQLAEKLPRQLSAEEKERRAGLRFELVPESLRREQQHWAPFKGRVEQWIATWFEPVAQEVAVLQAEVGQVRHLLEQRRQALALAA